MANIEFIPASNLPITEGSEVDLLCVENGELKRKAGASFGGGYDLVVRIRRNFDDDGNMQILSSEIVSGSYEAVREKYLNDQPMGIYFICIDAESGYKWAEMATEIDVCEGDFAYEAGDGIEVYLCGSDWWYLIKKDGTILTNY